MKSLVKTVSAAVIAGVVLTLSSVQNTNANEKAPTIVGIAAAVNADSGEFSTLIAALEYTGLLPALNAKKQFTVFAPTDAAFAKLGLNAENITTTFSKEDLTAILLYHVAPGKRASQAVVSAKQIRTLSKEFIAVGTNEEGKPTVDGAGFVAVDIKASNGIIHIVDTVLLP